MIRPLESAPTDTASGEPPAEVVTLPQSVVADLTHRPRIAARLLDRRADDRPRVEPLALRLDELADALGVNRRTLEREPHRRPSAQA